MRELDIETKYNVVPYIIKIFTDEYGSITEKPKNSSQGIGQHFSKVWLENLVPWDTLKKRYRKKIKKGYRGQEYNSVVERLCSRYKSLGFDAQQGRKKNERKERNSCWPSMNSAFTDSTIHRLKIFENKCIHTECTWTFLLWLLCKQYNIATTQDLYYIRYYK